MSADFERRIKFEPGYNYLHETGPSRRGQHGMQIRFLLIGPLGAAQFLMGTSWTPRGQDDHGTTEPVHIDHWREGSGYRFGLINPPSGYDLGYHWTVAQYDSQTPAPCDVLPAGECYYDGSGLAAYEVLRDFITEGEDAVWRWLEKRYAWCVEAVSA